jgi:hypothetical protein
MTALKITVYERWKWLIFWVETPAGGTSEKKEAGALS